MSSYSPKKSAEFSEEELSVLAQNVLSYYISFPQNVTSPDLPPFSDEPGKKPKPSLPREPQPSRPSDVPGNCSRW